MNDNLDKKNILKKCSKCGEYKKLNLFYKDKHRKDGHSDACIDCIYNHRKDKKHNQELQLKSCIINSVRIENKKLNLENKKLCTKCHNVFNINELTSGNMCKICRSKYTLEYSKKNKDKLNEYAKTKYQLNKEKIKEKQKEYREKNKEEISKKNKLRFKEYRLKKKIEKENQTK